MAGNSVGRGVNHGALNGARITYEQHLQEVRILGLFLALGQKAVSYTITDVHGC